MKLSLARIPSLGAATVLALLLAPTAPRTQENPRLLFDPNLSIAEKATLQQPMALGVRDLSYADPVWTPEGLWAARPQGRLGLAVVEQGGTPAFDPQSGAWFATADGALAEVRPDGTLPVVLDDVQALDVDVRAASGVVVVREPATDEIVLRRLQAPSERTVLMSGPAFFNPTLSPDGTRVLVAESRAEGGHLWLIRLGADPVDLGQGYQATWHPDGRHVVFIRAENDGYQVTASTLFVLDTETRREWSLGRLTNPVVLEPTVSPDGRFIAFADGAAEVYVAPFPALDKEGR